MPTRSIATLCEQVRLGLWSIWNQATVWRVGSFFCVFFFFFLSFLPGDPKVPVLYQVDRTRDGRSFTVRSVKAIQHGQPILICQASFQLLQPSPLQHQFPMPVVPQPEDLPTVEEIIQRYLRYGSVWWRCELGWKVTSQMSVCILWWTLGFWWGESITWWWCTLSHLCAICWWML